MVDEEDLENSVTFEIWAGTNRSRVEICLRLTISQQGYGAGGHTGIWSAPPNLTFIQATSQDEPHNAGLQYGTLCPS